jgi:hypothetical protein
VERDPGGQARQEARKAQQVRAPGAGQAARLGGVSTHEAAQTRTREVGHVRGRPAQVAGQDRVDHAQLLQAVQPAIGGAQAHAERERQILHALQRRDKERLEHGAVRRIQGDVRHRRAGAGDAGGAPRSTVWRVACSLRERFWRQHVAATEGWPCCPLSPLHHSPHVPTRSPSGQWSFLVPPAEAAGEETLEERPEAPSVWG